MWYLNFKIALRNILKHIGFSSINIGGLAIGLACCLVLLLYVSYEWSYDKQFKALDRIYYAKLNIKLNNELVTFGASPNKLAPAALQTLPGIENAARFSDAGIGLFKYKERAFKERLMYADASFLKIFSYQFIKGDALSALSAPDHVLLTERTAKKLFGDIDPMGKSIKWDNRKYFKVAAVIKDIPGNQSNKFDVLLSWAFFEQESPVVKNSGWGSINSRTVIQLKDNKNFAAADVALRKLIRSNESRTIMEAFLFPYSKVYLYNDFKNGQSVGGKIDQIRLFLFLAFCVLLIACINYMNLSTAKSEKRAREVGVRKVLGSSRKSIARQFLIESFLTSLIAMLIAFTLLELSLARLNDLLDIHMVIDYRSYAFWVTIFSLLFITSFLAGSYPAFYLSSFIPVAALKGSKRIGSSSLSVRKILVIVQFSLSVCMIICAMIIYNQIQFIQNKPLGFKKDNLVQLAIEGEWLKPGKLAVLKKELTSKGIIAAATEYSDSFAATQGSVTGEVNWPGKPINTTISFSYRSTGYDFTRTIGAQILKGRDFSRNFASDTSASVLLNESAVKVMELKNPVGTVINWEGKTLKIIGVVKNYNNSSVTTEAPPTLFYYGIKQSTMLLLRLHPAQNLNNALQSIKAISTHLNPEYPVDLQFIDHEMADKLNNEKLLSVLSTLFGGFAIFISCIGLLGLTLYITEQRSKEISIRKVLGANLKSILFLLNKDFIKLVIVSNVIAIPGAYIIATKWLQTYDYKSAISIWPFMAAIFISLFIAVLTVSLQTFKVVKANAIDALKYE
jgi:putative ABC transport system permease protein